MRQLNASTNLLLALLGGLGLLASLTLPWYAAPAEPPNPTDGPIERGAWQVGYVFATSARGMVDGNDAIGGGRVLLVVAIGAVALLALAISLNAARQTAEDILRVAALVVPVLVVGIAIAHPGTEAALRLHYGLLVAFAAALFTASAAWHGASWRQKYQAPARAFTR